jgi:hypothetical protein
MAITGGQVEDGGANLRVGPGNGDGICARTAADIQKLAAPSERKFRQNGRRRGQRLSVHRRHKITRARFVVAQV